MNAYIVFAGSEYHNQVVKLNTFSVIQNNRKQTVQVADYRSRLGRLGQMTFLNGLEATMVGARYVKAQSKSEMCAKLVLDEPEQAVDTDAKASYTVGS